MQQAGEIADGSMLDSAAAAIETQQPRGRAIRGRLLRNQFGGEIEVEIPDVHGSRMVLRARESGGL